MERWGGQGREYMWDRWRERRRKRFRERRKLPVLVIVLDNLDYY